MDIKEKIRFEENIENVNDISLYYISKYLRDDLKMVDYDEIIPDGANITASLKLNGGSGRGRKNNPIPSSTPSSLSNFTTDSSSSSSS